MICYNKLYCKPTVRADHRQATLHAATGNVGVPCLLKVAICVQWSLSEGAGARRLGEVRTRAAIQLLLVQACGEIFHVHSRCLAEDAITGILDVVKRLADHARQVDKDMALRRHLAAAQAHDKVSCPSLVPVGHAHQTHACIAQLCALRQECHGLLTY